MSNTRLEQVVSMVPDPALPSRPAGPSSFGSVFEQQHLAAPQSQLSQLQQLQQQAPSQRPLLPLSSPQGVGSQSWWDQFLALPKHYQVAIIIGVVVVLYLLYTRASSQSWWPAVLGGKRSANAVPILGSPQGRHTNVPVPPGADALIF